MKTLTFPFSLAAIFTLAGAPAALHAQERGYALNQFSPSERGSEWFAADSLDLRGELRPTFGVVGEWAYRPLVGHTADGNERSIVRNQFVLHPGASLVIHERVRIGLDVPVQVFADGRAVTVGTITYAPPESKTSLGDIRLAADVRLLGRYREAATLTAGLQADLPTGDRDSYAGDGATRLTPRVMVAGDISAFTYAAKLGFTIRTKDRDFAGSTPSHNVNLALAAGARVLDSRLVIGPELYFNTVVTHEQFFKKKTTPVEGLIGAHYTFDNGLRLGGGFGAGLSKAYGAPQHRGYLLIEWAPVIEPPAAPPPPSDRDADGIPDANDACPDQAGNADPDPAKNGCPPPSDRDHDTILDAQDACPDQAGDPNADPAKNGCPPPPDRDHDTILDAQDACPDQAGVANADPKLNGCPPPADKDGDGIVDAQDACPDAPGEASDDPKRHGCPKAFVQGSQIKILDQVKFKLNKAEIVPGNESEDVLQAVLKELTEHPEVKGLRIQGHTDNTGSAARNKELSKQRAQTVLDWLVKHGIDASRLTAEGFGPDKPLESNDTEAGRRVNRRVEFHLLETPQ